MRVASLFAGIGGFDLALERLGHEIVYANDFDKYAAQTYEKNFKTDLCGELRETSQGDGTTSTPKQSLQPTPESVQQPGDSTDYIIARDSRKIQRVDTRSIVNVPISEIPDHDLLVGGFPCQSFSIAGKRGGFNDTRGTMFFEIARILKDKRPSYLLLENVKGLLSHDNGRTFETIMRTLDELGYELQWQVLNSKNFGVPQNRERVFIIGHLRGTSRPQIFPIRERSQGINEPNGEKAQTQISNTIDSRTGSYPKWGQYVQRIPLKFLTRNQRNIEGDYAYTIDSANTGGLNVNGAIRRLTPTECERLQGFPDGWTAGVSDTQRYKQLGNAVTVNVVYEVAKSINDGSGDLR